VPSMGSVPGGSRLFPFWSGVTDEAGCVGGSMAEEAPSTGGWEEEESCEAESGLYEFRSDEGPGPDEDDDGVVPGFPRSALGAVGTPSMSTLLDPRLSWYPCEWSDDPARLPLPPRDDPYEPYFVSRALRSSSSRFAAVSACRAFSAATSCSRFAIASAARCSLDKNLG
jgi:hypothetical protein